MCGTDRRTNKLVKIRELLAALHQRNLQIFSECIRFETLGIAAQNELPLIKFEDLNSWLTNAAIT
ncbi:hypothetical protein AB4653_24785, partial [Vibrio sp. 10N.222.48.A3]